MNHLRAVYTIWYRDLLRFWHDRMLMIGSTALPLLFLFVFGSGLSGRMGFLKPWNRFHSVHVPGHYRDDGTSKLVYGWGIGSLGQRVWLLEGGTSGTHQPYLSSCGEDIGFGNNSTAPLGMLILLFAPLLGVSLSVSTVLALLPLVFLLAA